MGWRVVGAALAAVVAASGWPLQLAQAVQAAELPTVSVTPAPPMAEVEETGSEELDSPAPTPPEDTGQEMTLDADDDTPTLPAQSGSAAQPAAPAPALAEQTTALEPGESRLFVSSNGTQFAYHWWQAGANGTVIYFDGDGTSSFTDLAPGGFSDLVSNSARVRGMNFVFLNHPDGGDSWWENGDPDTWAVAVREFISRVPNDNLLLVGYSGGAEFLARHLLLPGTDWLPANSAAVMIGGGDIEWEEVSPAGIRRDVLLDWVVGAGDDSPGWSALRTSEVAHEAYVAAGYTRAARVVTCGSHDSYDLPSIIGWHADQVLAQASHLPDPVWGPVIDPEPFAACDGSALPTRPGQQVPRASRMSAGTLRLVGESLRQQLNQPATFEADASPDSLLATVDDGWGTLAAGGVAFALGWAALRRVRRRHPGRE